MCKIITDTLLQPREPNPKRTNFHHWCSMKVYVVSSNP